MGLSGRPLIIFFFFQNGTNESEAPSVLGEKQLIYEVEIANPSLEEVAMAILTPRRKKLKFFIRYGHWYLDDVEKLIEKNV